MKKIILSLSLSCISFCVMSQSVIHLYKERPNESKGWNQKEDSMYSDLFKTEVVYNVTDPSLIVYKPNSSIKNTGTAIIIAPGGGFQSLSINREGIDLAKWLSTQGITAFVLKYRLLESKTKDPAKEMMANLVDRKAFEQKTLPIRAMAGEDINAALQYVRDHSNEYGIAENKVGVIGFSAGGSVVLQSIFKNENKKPDFASCIYSDLSEKIAEAPMPKDTLPMFIASASDDQLKLTPKSIALYQKWYQAGYPVEIHIYEKGGHGFGMGKQNLPVDHWIDQYANWLKEHKYL